MRFSIKAACGCNKGKIRSNNEDNFYFDGKCLEVRNEGLEKSAVLEGKPEGKMCFAVFDGMGGENFGEEASYAAARELQLAKSSAGDFFISREKYLSRLALRLNEAVVARAKELLTKRMGSTMVSLYLGARHAYICNLGDSRAYRLREEELLQLSQDHVSSRPLKPGHKAPLTQHLGIDSEDMLIEPYILKTELKPGDRYLLCSDGLTDMLDDGEIRSILLENEDCPKCADMLISGALEHGGRDNVTVIVLSVMQEA